MPNDAESRDGTSGWLQVIRPYRLTVGDRCRVEPLNPQRLKNRGRVCIIEGFRRFGNSAEMAAVTWEDTQEYGGAEIADLVVIGD